MNLERARPSPAGVPNRVLCDRVGDDAIGGTEGVRVATKSKRLPTFVLIAPTFKPTVEFYFSSCAAMLIDPPVTFILRCQSL